MSHCLVKVFFVGAMIVVAPWSAGAANITFDTVAVGDEGNANDQNYSGQGAFGAVNYRYRISTYEVTNAQYAEFLNAKAASDPFSLYNANMGSNARGGILRSGVSGSFTYSVKTDMDDKPVNFVRLTDAYRFTNWLNNGQGSGDTETGAYTMANPIARNAGATWFLPSENEWYKAAYYDPRTEANGGPIGGDNYWRYAYASDATPVTASAIDLIGPTRGDIANPGQRVTNKSSGADWNGQNGNVTTVGSAGPLTASYYGTFDQGGNVGEFVESGIRRGGAYESITTVEVSASNRESGFQSFEIASTGFRVATVPEPSSFLLAACGGSALALAARRRRARRR